MANQHGQHRDRDRESGGRNPQQPHQNQNQDRERSRGDNRRGQGSVEEQNIGDGTDSGGSGYREQQYPGQGPGETRPGQERRSNRDHHGGAQDKSGQGSQNR